MTLPRQTDNYRIPCRGDTKAADGQPGQPAALSPRPESQRSRLQRPQQLQTHLPQCCRPTYSPPLGTRAPGTREEQLPGSDAASGELAGRAQAQQPGQRQPSGAQEAGEGEGGHASAALARPSQTRQAQALAIPLC